VPATATSVATRVPATATRTPAPPLATSTAAPNNITAVPVSSTPTPCAVNDNAAIEGHSYSINGGSSTSALQGKVVSGNQVVVHFAIAAGCSNVLVSLVSYTAPSALPDRTSSQQEVVYDSASGLFSAGSDHTLQVNVPPCFFSLDFVRGAIIERFGPPDSTNYYADQARLIDSASGGTASCSTPTPAPENTATATVAPTGSATAAALLVATATDVPLPPTATPGVQFPSIPDGGSYPPTKTPEAPSSVLFGAGLALLLLALGRRAWRR
jgi:hypothetical protein